VQTNQMQERVGTYSIFLTSRCSLLKKHGRLMCEYRVAGRRAAGQSRRRDSLLFRRRGRRIRMVCTRRPRGHRGGRGKCAARGRARYGICLSAMSCRWEWIHSHQENRKSRSIYQTHSQKSDATKRMFPYLHVCSCFTMDTITGAHSPVHIDLTQWCCRFYCTTIFSMHSQAPGPAQAPGSRRIGCADRSHACPSRIRTNGHGSQAHSAQGMVVTSHKCLGRGRPAFNSQGGG